MKHIESIFSAVTEIPIVCFESRSRAEFPSLQPVARVIIGKGGPRFIQHTENNQYAYQLIGFDKKLVRNGTKRDEIEKLVREAML